MDIKTTVIDKPVLLDQHLRNFLVRIRENVNENMCKYVVGLGVEKQFTSSSSSNNSGSSNQVSERVAVLKLCHGTACLIIQLLHMETAPCSLSNFLQLRELSFVGVGIKHCLEALEREYGLKCRNAVDLAELAANVKQNEAYRGYGLLDLLKAVCFYDVRQHLMHNITTATLSNWGATKLSQKQIEAASSDAFMCFYLGNNLFGGYFRTQI